MNQESQTGSETRSFLATTNPSELDWFEFVNRYGPRLLKWCRQRGLGREASECVTQDVLSRLSKALKSFSYEGNSFRGWLYGVTRNAIADYRKTWQRGDVQFMDAAETLLESADNLIEEIVSSDIQQISEERTRGKVTLRQWETYVLRQHQRCEYAEIAERLQVSEETAQNYVSIVKSTLLAEIEKLRDGEME
jgi:RNA polymerase sigma factor (sigma-70 family)